MALQEANLLIEKGGPEAVPLGDEVIQELDDFDIVVVQLRRSPARFSRRPGG